MTPSLAVSTPESSNQAYSNLVAIGSITLEIASEGTQSPPAGLEVSTGMPLSARILWGFACSEPHFASRAHVAACAPTRAARVCVCAPVRVCAHGARASLTRIFCLPAAQCARCAYAHYARGFLALRMGLLCVEDVNAVDNP